MNRCAFSPMPCRSPNTRGWAWQASQPGRSQIIPVLLGVSGIASPTLAPAGRCPAAATAGVPDGSGERAADVLGGGVDEHDVDRAGAADDQERRAGDYPLAAGNPGLPTGTV